MKIAEYRAKKLWEDLRAYGYLIKLAHPVGETKLEERHYIVTWNMMKYKELRFLDKIRVVKSTIEIDTLKKDIDGNSIYEKLK